MAAEELRSRHASLASGLQFQDLNSSSCSRSNQEAGRVLGPNDHLPCGNWLPIGIFLPAGSANDEPHGLLSLVVVQVRVSRRPGLHGTDLVADITCMAAPINQAMLFGQLWCFGRLGLVLFGPASCSGCKLVDHLKRKPAPQDGQPTF